jgi:peptidoglycan/LPS O-acetylase OafA/YrhL
MTAVDTTSVAPVPTGRRERGGSERFPLIDGYRALAATAVVMTHVGFQTGEALNGSFSGLLARLDVGVTLFFLISGFLLFRPHAVRHLTGESAPRLKPYVWRRAVRLLPALWLAIAGTALLVNQTEHVPIRTWLAQVFLVQTYVRDSQLLGFTQIWSLATEVAFYAFLPLLGWLLTLLKAPTVEQRMRRQILLLAPLLLVPLAYRGLVYGDVIDSNLALFWLPAYIDWFAIGMLLASVHAYRAQMPQDHRWTRLEDIASAPGACWAAAACVGWIATTEIAGPLSLLLPTFWEATFKHFLYAAFATLLLLPGLFGDPGRGLTRRFMGSLPMRFLGEISYGIFLWNMGLLFATYRLFDLRVFSGNYGLVFVCVFALSVTTAAASYYCLERPVLRLKSRVR